MKLSYSTLVSLAEADEGAAEALNQFRFYRSVFPNRGRAEVILCEEEYRVYWLPNFQAMVKNRLEINMIPASIK